METELERFNPFIEAEATYRELNGGDQWRFTFRNGYGASVIRSSMSYGGDSGLWELAVLDASGQLTYDTPITDDVLGRLSKDEVAVLLLAVASLP